MVIAIQFGLTSTLACGAAAYLLALALMPSLASKTTFRGGVDFVIILQSIGETMGFQRLP